MPEQAILSNRSSKYVSVACNLCKRRRRKCDGQTPCRLCSSLKKKCVYEKEKDGRRKKNQSDYIKYLEEQNDTLKSVVEKIVDKETVADPNYLTYLFSDGETSDNNDNNKVIFDGNFNRAIDDLADMVWKLELSSPQTTKFLGPSSNCITKLSQVGNLKKLEAESGLNSLKILNQNNSTYNFYQDHVLHDKKFLGQLCSIFTRNFVQYNISLVSLDLNQLLNEHFSDDEGLKNSGIRTLFLYSVFAYGFNLLPTDDSIKASLGSSNYFLTEVESSLLIILKDYNDMSWESQKYILYVLMTLTCLYLGNYDEVLSWSYNSLLGAQLIHLGLHVNPCIPDENTYDQDTIKANKIIKERSKIFWNCVIIGRLATTILGRNSAINYKRILTQFYITDDPENPDDLIFQYSSKFWFLYDQYLDEIYSFHFNEYNESKKLIILASAVKSWKSCYDGLPDNFSLHNVLNESSIFQLPTSVLLYHLSFHVALLLLYRPYILLKKYSSSIFSKCILVLRKCISIVGLLDKKLFDYDYPFYYGYLLSSVIVFQELFFTIDKFKTGEFRNYFSLTLNSLKRGANLWPAFEVYIESLYNRANVWKLDEGILLEFSLVSKTNNSLQPGTNIFGNENHENLLNANSLGEHFNSDLLRMLIDLDDESKMNIINRVISSDLTDDTQELFFL